MLKLSFLRMRLPKTTDFRTMLEESPRTYSPISSTTLAGTMASSTEMLLKSIGESMREILMVSRKYPSCCSCSAFDPRWPQLGTSETKAVITGCIFRNYGKEKYAATAATRELKMLKNRLIPSIPPSGVVDLNLDNSTLTPAGLD